MDNNNVLDDNVGFVKLVDAMGSDISVVNAARVSFGKKIESMTDKDISLVEYLLKEKHSSPFEHVTFTFHVKCPLFVARQWMRHRTQSYNEISRRYTSENIEFFLPKEFRYQDSDDRQASSTEKKFLSEENQVFFETIAYSTNIALGTYEFLVGEGVAREMARIVLPQNMYTEFYTTVNLWNLFHFISLRTSDHAQLEIRNYAVAMEELISTTVPYSVGAWRKIKEIK